eukprot:TRINITY_DN42090_c0_g1_i1.p1 TRINITY_DN42090_c0_g1~~TRINITY_DN42090_c0_g1_i1.p1  ORF type:complete len:372 (+),score=85.07 TRINITY_DN42090_c0_g1_i1:69-1118(+)
MGYNSKDDHSSLSEDSPLNPGSPTVRKAAPDGIVQLGNVEIPWTVVVGASVAFMLVFAFGLGIPLNYDDGFWACVSGVCGWISTAAWGISFYPQVYLNWVRKSVVGMSFDFQYLNLIGFACYSIMNVCYYSVQAIKDDYSEMHDNSTSAVEANDVAFAIHAEILTAITFGQIFIYERGTQTFNKVAIAISCIAFMVYGAWFLDLVIKGGRYSDRARPFIWLDFLSGLAYFKLAISIVKYTPQVYLNWQRKRTTGWNIWNVLLDFTGGTLSLAQLFIDCIRKSDWSKISGDPVKFGLGFCSMMYDTIFMIQHYILYAEGNAQDLAEDEAAKEEKGGEVNQGDVEAGGERW